MAYQQAQRRPPRTLDPPQPRDPVPPPRERVALARITGSYSDVHAANESLQIAAASFHLISPAASIGALPVGCELALAGIQVALKETYDVGMGKRALHKAPLERIAANVGISWIPEACYRVDDGSDPHYCLFRAAGRYRAFDGQFQTLIGWREIDLRDGSARCREIARQCDRANKNPKNRNKPARDPRDQITQERSHILAHAETKAKLRAIRSLGVQAGYTEQELETPFVCARVMFTGQTEDPELKRMFASQVAASFLGATQTAYGGTPPALPARTQQPAVDNKPGSVPPPPVGSSHTGDDADPEPLGDDADDTDPYEGQSYEGPEDAAEPLEEPKIPGGDQRGWPLSKASMKNLRYWADRIRNELDNDSSRDPERDEQLFEALLDEIQKRDQ